MPALTVTIDGTTRTTVTLMAGTSITLERPMASATLLVADTAASITVDIHDEVFVKDGATVVFRGIVLNRSFRKLGASGRYIVLECVDKVWAFSRGGSSISKGYTSASDQTIVIDLVAEAGLTASIDANTTHVDSTVTGLTLAFGPRATLFAALQEVAKLADAKWHLDYQASGADILHYEANSAAAAAPWDVDCDSPNGSATFSVRTSAVLESDGSRILNSVTVVGGFTEDGIELTASGSDSTSQTAFGVVHETITSTDWNSQTQVDEIAATAIAQFKDTIERFQFTCIDSDGRALLGPNQVIGVKCSDFGLSASVDYLIQRVTLTQVSSTITRMSVECGEKLPNLQALVERFAGQNRALRSAAAFRFFCVEFGTDANVDEYFAWNQAAFDSIQTKTFAFWVKLTSDGALQEFFSKGTVWRLEYTATDELRFFEDHATTDIDAISVANVLTVGEWQHVMVIEQTAGGGAFQADLYVDGTEVSYGTHQNSVGSLTADTGADFEFGGGNSSAQLEGRVSNIVGLTVVPDATDIANLSSAVQYDVSKTIAKHYIKTGGILGWWKGDDHGIDPRITHQLTDFSSAGNTSTTVAGANGPDGVADIFIPA